MRITFISDTHSLHDGMRHDLKKFIDPKQDNILIHAGDCTNVGKEHEVKEFVEWFQNLEGFDTKIFIAGNHDFAFETKPPWLSHFVNPENLSQSNCYYLEDEEFVIESSEFSKPIKFYGSPWQPWFYDWAFNLPRNGEEIEKKWKAIPDDTTVLITHGPAHGVLDFTPRNERVGCEVLRFRVEQFKPLIHVFGHIHGAYGSQLLGDTLFVNASTCTEKYHPINKPIVVDINEVYGDLVATVIDTV